MEFQTKSTNELEEIARKILKLYPLKRYYFLNGELGSGKTTFTSAFIKVLGAIESAQSPTFILHREYGLEEGITAHHIDLYRIDNEIELAELKLEKLRTLKDFVLIEWAEKYIDILESIFPPDKILTLEFEYGKEQNDRLITVSEYIKEL